ncbi:DUF4126 domain-containing protein [Sphingomonas sp. RP10(2022)]|uniref:DUF4126 domain-containing protein n=1 Tax=Sphingomonas liriopis TaxID=2949094 RepID=A0A9X2HU08_9SPHN|nr:DUF4126 domain-containing protein [Sphingomonas liriopis]MCP3734376.1 DUF4126 domain-containing protein [Sphingomonas liriopis]
MLRSILIGLVAGQRGLTPLAVVAGAAVNGRLPKDAPGGALLAHPAVAAAAVSLAAAEMAGDKMPTAPNRTVVAGLLARSLTAAFAGAALAPKPERKLAAAVAVATAIASSHLGLALRLRAMKRWGQTATGAVEDALVLGSGLAIANLRR